MVDVESAWIRSLYFFHTQFLPICFHTTSDFFPSPSLSVVQGEAAAVKQGPRRGIAPIRRQHVKFPSHEASQRHLPRPPELCRALRSTALSMVNDTVEPHVNYTLRERQLERVTNISLKVYELLFL